ncbi:MAG TPA: pseudouridine synthase [Candidatus Paceibacterota bacterium]|nr:pseudouridine synthase [Candidatus Paceibacterota bacterium]
MGDKAGIRINKYLRDQGVASRREADELVRAGSVFINGVRASMGALVGNQDKVTLKGVKDKDYIYLAYYKPRGIPTQSNEEENVIGQWTDKGLFPIGRLDKQSEGLIILTNDGRITSKILGAESKFEKEYLVKVKEHIRSGVEGIIKKGMMTETFGKLLPAEARIVGNNEIRIVLHEGKKHQIRVMLGELNYTVTSLKRLRVGEIKLGNLKPGNTRNLTAKEIETFFK